MNFSNLNVSPDELPSVETAAFNPLEKNYLKAERITFFISTVVLVLAGVAVFYFVERIQTRAIIYTAIAVFVVISVLGWLSDSIGFKYSGYALRDRDVLIRKGWLIRKVGVVPLNRIQHVSIQSGPIERKFGLASVSIYTAGSDDADVTIKGITEETAQKIKEWISNQLNGDIR
jgi:membrane protein YdbS with pleckstrin-like domain